MHIKARHHYLREEMLREKPLAAFGRTGQASDVVDGFHAKVQKNASGLLPNLVSINNANQKRMDGGIANKCRSTNRCTRGGSRMGSRTPEG